LVILQGGVHGRERDPRSALELLRRSAGGRHAFRFDCTAEAAAGRALGEAGAMEAFVDTVVTAEDGLAQIYDIKSELSGAQSGCVEVIDKRSGVHYAMRSYKRGELTRRKRAELCQSIDAQRVLADPPPDSEDLRMAKLATLHEVVQTPRELMLVNELVPLSGADDLLSMIERRGRLSEANSRQIFAKLVLATKRAHDSGVAVRNIKPETVQVQKDPVDGSLVIWLADMRCAAKVDPVDLDVGTLSGLHGTPEYSAPEEVIWYWHEAAPPSEEQQKSAMYGAKVDVWALGMCLHVMLCGCFPFDSSASEEDMLRAINAASFSYSDPGWSKVSEDALDLVQQLLQRDPLDRPFLEEVLQHPFCATAVSETVRIEREASMKNKDMEAALAALDLDDDD